jgi:hypothetical protein
MGYMLDLYALLKFECSPDLKEALLNNYLFNLGEEVGNFIEGDLMQECVLQSRISCTRLRPALRAAVTVSWQYGNVGMPSLPSSST